jgi:RNA polymerase sigma-70 factor (ECF subfamily)
VRAELCDEALRLAHLLVEHRLTAVPATHALAALMNLLAARLPGRTDAEGNLLLLVDQDRARWDTTRIAEGIRQIELSAAGDELTVYHLEAVIAAMHAKASSTAETDWAGIVAIYDTLMKIQPSPVVALNRAVAIAQRDGPERGLEEIDRIEERARLARFPFLYIAVGELTLRLGRNGEAQRSFEKALGLARNPAERRFLIQRLQASEA